MPDVLNTFCMGLLAFLSLRNFALSLDQFLLEYINQEEKHFISKKTVTSSMNVCSHDQFVSSMMPSLHKASGIKKLSSDVDNGCSLIN